MPGKIRFPAVAGRFYPSDPKELLDSIHSYLEPSIAGDLIPAIGCIVPHAGYVYSGATAGAVFSRIVIPNQCILLCPNHTGQGTPLSIMTDGTWQTPLGMVQVNEGLAAALKEHFPALNDDRLAHHNEHAIEVELPFLQVLTKNDFTIVPIVLGTQRYDVLRALGEVMAGVVATQPGKTLIIASSDMNHYESDAITRVKDSKALEYILAMDAQGLSEVVLRENISMCGMAAAVVMLTAARRQGATQAELIQYATSADVSGDRTHAVGYAGVVVR